MQWAFEDTPPGGASRAAPTRLTPGTILLPGRQPRLAGLVEGMVPRTTTDEAARPQGRQWLSLVLLLLAALGCGDGAGPSDPLGGPVGSYALRQAAGSNLPAVVFDERIGEPGEDFHLVITVLSGSLRLDVEGGYRQELRYRATIDGVDQLVVRLNDRGSYTVGPDSLRFESEQVQNVRFAGTLGSTGLIISQDVAGEGVAVAYRYQR